MGELNRAALLSRLLACTVDIAAFIQSLEETHVEKLCVRALVGAGTLTIKNTAIAGNTVARNRSMASLLSYKQFT